jgi:hypothetical protein
MLAKPQVLQSDNSGYYSLKNLFFSPLRYCGRQWVWVKSNPDDQISQTALKILASPFLACATLFSGLPALIGAFIFSPDTIPTVTKYSPRGDLALLKNNVSNEEIAERIKRQLNLGGVECSVEVQSRDREILNDYYPDSLHRCVTLVNPSNATLSRVKEVLKSHFHNKDISDLNNLYACIYEGAASEDLDRLKDVLALHGAVTFSLAFDLAYVRTELGRPLFTPNS